MPIAKPARPTYDNVAIAFHWIGALLILWIFYLGLAMTSDLFSNFARRSYHEAHKAAGVFAFFFALARFGWHLRTTEPPLISKGLKPWEIMVSYASKKLLYVLLIFVPLSGWMYYSVSPYKADFFGLFPIPDLFFLPNFQDATEAWHETLEGLHVASAYTFGALILAHVAAMMKNHFILKNGALVRIAPPFARKTLMQIREKAFWAELEGKAKALIARVRTK